MRRNNKYFNVKGGKTIGISANGNYSFNVGGGSAPVADFTVNNATPNRYQNIQFTDTSTGNPTEWLWDFGDGNTSTDQNPIHFYEYGDEDYTVTLTVTNSTGTSTETKTDLISLDEVTFDTLMRRYNDEFYIPANTPGYTFNYSVGGAGDLVTGLTDNYTYIKTAASTNTFWRINIRGKYPIFDSTNPFLPRKDRVSGLYRWGTIKWESMENFFRDYRGITGNGYYTGEDVPDLRLVTSMENMFRNSAMKNIKNFADWDVSTITNMERVFHTADHMDEEVDWSDPVRGSINATTITGFAYHSVLTSVKLQAGSVTSATNAFYDTANLTELILIGMSVDFDISSTALTGVAIDALADSVADMTGQASPTVTMTQAQLDSCDHDKWLDKNWTTVPAHQTSGPEAFIMKVNSGSNSEFTIPTISISEYDYTVATSDGQTFTGVTGDKTITFPAANTDYDISITGTFPWIIFSNGGDRLKLKEIKQWGNQKWSTMQNAFWGCENMIITATDAPDLSNVTNMNHMFHNCLLFNTNINHWDTSNVIVMSDMFNGASSFDQPLNNWDTSNVTGMSNMFRDASSFNQPLNNWNTSNVASMSGMFTNASSFNQPLNNWNTSNVFFMTVMFANTSFNQNISGWNVTKVTDWAYFSDGAPLTTANTPPKFR